jgi:Mrp family chromosome partitioning ATPase
VTAASNLLRQIEHTLRLPFRAAVEMIEPGEQTADDMFEPLIQRFIEIRHSRAEGAIFAFSSISAGEGVSYVTGQIAWELSRRSDENVLLTTAASLNETLPASIAEAEFGGRKSGKVWKFANRFDDPEAMQLHIRLESLRLLRSRFSYVLIDFPALRQSTAIVPMSRYTDGVVLVIAAGETRRDHIGPAQSLFQASSCNLLGLVLNKRTNPVPKAIAQYL